MITERSEDGSQGGRKLFALRVATTVEFGAQLTSSRQQGLE